MFEATPFTRTVHPDKTAEQYRTDIACVCVNLNRHVDLAKALLDEAMAGTSRADLAGMITGFRKELMDVRTYAEKRCGAKRSRPQKLRFEKRERKATGARVPARVQPTREAQR